MVIHEILQGITPQKISGPLTHPIEGLCIDSRKWQRGDAFVCIRGSLFDSHTLAPSLYERGARVFFSEVVLDLPEDAFVAVLPNMRSSLSLLAQNFFSHPARQLLTIGITGSKGKTTLAHMIYALLEAAGQNPGILGTNGAWMGAQEFPIGNTTPEPLELQRTLRQMCEAGCQSVVMEVSSQAMKYARVDGMCFDLGIFLNFEKGDHVSPLEHPNYEDYYASKKAFLPLCKKTLIWSGEPCLEDLRRDLQDTHTYGREAFADYQMTDTLPTSINGNLGMRFWTTGRLEGTFEVHSLGEVGALNALAALASMDLLGFDVKEISSALKSLSITGRMEWIHRSEDYQVLIDFAHNGLSARAVLQALRQYKPRRLVCLFGVNGDRDVHRRKGMGEAAGQYADLSIITEGHNRSEPFEDILSGILEGMDGVDGKYLVIPDRKNALKWALAQREPGDILAILGLGHEEYLEKEGKRIPHSDRETVRQMLQEAEPAKNL